MQSAPSPRPSQPICSIVPSPPIACHFVDPYRRTQKREAAKRPAAAIDGEREQEALKARGSCVLCIITLMSLIVIRCIHVYR